MTITPASLNDIDRIMETFQHAKMYMRGEGNLTQWSSNYPSRELIIDEINNHHCYICTDSHDTFLATFCLIHGEDATYSIINGKWLNNLPYATIHRMASNGKQHGIAREIFNWCFNLYPNLRVDTHADNTTMQKAILKNGFKYCGIIHVADGSPRLAYQKCK